MSNAKHTVAHTPTPWTFHYQDASHAAYAAGAIAEGADEEFAGPGEEGWYLLDPDTGGAVGPLDPEKVRVAYRAHDALVAALTLAVARLERIDKKLVELNGQPFENELGEVIRARKALALAKGEA